ncbi:MAG: hypothetical protein DMD35_09985 [Gemmatimonadetes bacterium]|nr:MAG: hypothetical protein DMD35_09985 [Gemmatimonadota bacterium]
MPQLIAAALIAKEPTRYGMTLHTLPPLAYDSVRVPPSTPLAAIAKAAHATTRDILDLNPHLLRGMTPPRESYQMRIPTGTAASFDSAFAALPEIERTATHRLETKKGDTPERIASAHDISVSALKGFNPSMERLKSGRLAVGQILLIPTPAVAAASLVVPDPAIEKFPHSSARLKVHTVRRGETMRSIARKYDTTPERLMRINGLRKAVIFPGQTLLLSGTSRSAKRSSDSSRSKSSATAKSGSKKHSGAGSKASARTKSKSAKSTAGT